MLLGEIFLFGDLTAFHYPTRLIYSSSLSNGEFPLWVKHFYGGYPLVAEGQIGAFHPLHIFLYYFFPTLFSILAELLFSYLFAYIGACLFFKKLELSSSFCL